MLTPNGFVMEQVCFDVVNMFARLNCLYQMYGILFKLQNLLVLAHTKCFLINSSGIKGFTALPDVWAAGPMILMNIKENMN